MSAPTKRPAGGRGFFDAAAFALLANVAGPIANFATAPILAISLGVQGRGEVAAVTAPLVLLSVAASVGMPEAVTNVVARYGYRPTARLRMCALAIGLAAALIGIVATWLAASWLTAGDASLAHQLQLVTFALIPTMGLALVRASAAAEMEWRTIAAERLVAGGIRLCATAALAVTGSLTVLSASLVLAIAPLVGAAAYVRCWQRMRSSERGDDSGEPIAGTPQLTSFGLRIWIGSLSGILLSRLDQILLTPLSGARELGLYVVAVSISEIAILGNSAVRDVLFSSHSREPSWARVGAAARISNLLCFTSAAVGGAVSFWLIPVIFGQDFAPSVPIVIILLVAMVLGNPGSTVGAGLSGQGRPGVRSVGMVLAASLNVVLLIAFAPSLGGVGAAWATLAGTAFAGWFNIAAASRIFGVRLSEFLLPKQSDLDLLFRLIFRRGD